MGATDSKQKLGERVIAARRKFDDDIKMQAGRSEELLSKSPETMKFTLSSIESSFANCAPFLEPTLLLAWKADREKCKDIMVKACTKVLSAPIKEADYSWFKQYVLPSSIWMLRTKQGRHMYEELMDIVQSQSKNIIRSMDSIYAHLRTHEKWSQLMAIQEESVVARQDHESVGLLRDKGIVDVGDIKDGGDGDGDDGGNAEQLQTFVDSHVAINALAVNAKIIDGEFQNYVKTLMGRYGTFRAAPMKKVERCLSKLENDYQAASYPKAAKLLDLVRCSVTFNTMEQLLDGFSALVDHVKNPQQTMKLARVKNGFLDGDFQGGYRDIKVNVIYHSAMHPEIKMVCEVQLILSQFLHEKKKIHKLYSIAREQAYFDMVVQEPEQESASDGLPPVARLSDLKFREHLNVGHDAQMEYRPYSNTEWIFGKCSVDSSLGLLGLEGVDWFGIVDVESKKSVFEIKRDAPRHPWYARNTHAWITINGEKYVSVQMSKTQIKMFKVTESANAASKFEFVEDPKYTINFEKGNIINYCSFDKEFKSLLLLINNKLVQKRSMPDVNNITTEIQLEEEVAQSSFNQLNFTADGSLCALGGGASKNYFYVIDIEKQKQYKLVSKVLTDTYAPCFINGERKYVSMGDKQGRVEVWDFEVQKPIKVIDIGVKKWVPASASTNNILAIASYDQNLRLYDINNWKCFYEKNCNVDAGSLHLTSDLKYLTVGGIKGIGCTVLKIQK